MNKNVIVYYNMVKKGEILTGAKPGGRLAYDATKDTHKKLASKTTMARPTTKKGNARKTAPVGARKAYAGGGTSSASAARAKAKFRATHAPSTGLKAKTVGGGLGKWRAAVTKAHKQLGTSGVPRRGSEAHTLATKFHKGGK
jgi:hypothetical protein